jgi:hypothetical protein
MTQVFVTILYDQLSRSCMIKVFCMINFSLYDHNLIMDMARPVTVSLEGDCIITLVCFWVPRAACAPSITFLSQMLPSC